MEFNFKGQTAVVTGGTRGIGRGVSEALLKAGAKVVATYQSNDKAAKEGRGAAQLDGRMIDAASTRMAENIVNINSLIQKK